MDWRSIKMATNQQLNPIQPPLNSSQSFLFSSFASLPSLELAVIDRMGRS
jgi:hypothetical protein